MMSIFGLCFATALIAGCLLVFAVAKWLSDISDDSPSAFTIACGIVLLAIVVLSGTAADEAYKIGQRGIAAERAR